MTATNLITGIKQVNSGILQLKTWLIISKIIPLVKYLLKKSLNTLNEIKNAGIVKYKNHTPGQKELLWKWRWWWNNESKRNNRKIKFILDEIIDKSKSFEKQIKSFKNLKGLKRVSPL